MIYNDNLTVSATCLRFILLIKPPVVGWWPFVAGIMKPRSNCGKLHVKDSLNGYSIHTMSFVGPSSLAHQLVYSPRGIALVVSGELYSVLLHNPILNRVFVKFFA